jgi:hypothetical protein
MVHKGRIRNLISWKKADAGIEVYIQLIINSKP